MTIFLIVISVILLSLTVISLFFFQKESELRTLMEGQLQETTQTKSGLQADLKESQKQVFLFEEKIKEADEKINSLLDDLELEEGLRDEMKKENQALKDALSNENQQREKLEKSRMELDDKLKQTTQNYEAMVAQLQALKDRNTLLEEQNTRLQMNLEETLVEGQSLEEPVETIELQKEIFSTEESPEGKILSIDPQHDFVIFNLGRQHGISEGLVMSVYHGNKFLGDVRVSRIQDEMSAADIIPPLSSRKIRENDRVVVKQ